METAVHTFLDCWWVKAFWYYVKLDQLIYLWKCDDMGQWLWQCVSSIPLDKLVLLLYGLYMVWYCRNSLAHGKKCLPLISVAIRTQAKATTILDSRFKLLVISDEVEFSWAAHSI